MWHERGGVLLPLWSAEIKYVYIRRAGRDWGLVFVPPTVQPWVVNPMPYPLKFSNDGCLLSWRGGGERWNFNGCKASLPKILILGIIAAVNVGTVFAKSQLNIYTWFCIFIHRIIIHHSLYLYTPMIRPVICRNLYLQYTFILAITFRSDGRPPI